MSAEQTMTRQWEAIGLDGERMTVLADTPPAAAAYAAKGFNCRADDVIVRYRLTVGCRHAAAELAKDQYPIRRQAVKR